jgi:DNA-directed RNA polymerase alpha subunit
MAGLLQSYDKMQNAKCKMQNAKDKVILTIVTDFSVPLNL